MTSKRPMFTKMKKHVIRVIQRSEMSEINGWIHKKPLPGRRPRLDHHGSKPALSCKGLGPRDGRVQGNWPTHTHTKLTRTWKTKRPMTRPTGKLIRA